MTYSADHLVRHHRGSHGRRGSYGQNVPYPGFGKESSFLTSIMARPASRPITEACRTVTVEVTLGRNSDLAIAGGGT
jgi:hypothetical protein